LPGLYSIRKKQLKNGQGKSLKLNLAPPGPYQSQQLPGLEAIRKQQIKKPK
jgi:hypothetical protein